MATKGRYLSIFTLLFLVFLLPILAFPNLKSNTPYLITLDKIDAEGDPILVSSQIATADSKGVVSYGFDNVPTCDEDGIHFLLITVGEVPEDTQPDGRLIGVSGRLAQVLVPAPVKNGQSFTGASDLTGLQTKAILQTFDISQTGDPFLATLGNVVFKSPSLDANIVTYMGLMLQIEVMDPYSGFYAYLSNTAKLSDARLNHFRSSLVCASPVSNPSLRYPRFASYINTSAALDLGYSLADLSKDLYEAETTHSDDGDSLNKEIAKIGNRVAKVVLNAASAIDSDGQESIGAHHLLNAMHKIKFNSLSGDYLTESAAVRQQASRILEFAWRTMIQRLYPETSKREWISAMQTLGATESQIADFVAAIVKMDNAFDSIASSQADTYQSYDGTASVSDKFGAMFNSGRDIINDFTEDIQANESDIRLFINDLADYMDYDNLNLGYTPLEDPYDDDGFFGPYKVNMFSNYAGFTDEGYLRMSIPQLVIYNFVYSKLKANEGSEVSFRSGYNWNGAFQNQFKDGWRLQMINWFVLCNQAQRAYLYYKNDYWNQSNQIIEGRDIYADLLTGIANDIDIVDSNNQSLITSAERTAIVTLFKEAEKLVYSQIEGNEIYSEGSNSTLFNNSNGDRRYYATMLKEPNSNGSYSCYADGITSKLTD